MYKWEFAGNRTWEFWFGDYKQGSVERKGRISRSIFFVTYKNELIGSNNTLHKAKSRLIEKVKQNQVTITNVTIC